MKARIIVAIIGVPLTAAVIFFAPDWLFLLCLAAVAFICVIELLITSRKWYVFLISAITLFVFYLLYALRTSYGPLLVLLVFGCAYSCDAGAMAAGKLFGKRRPFPTLSPSKTIAGFVGGLITPIVFSLFFIALFGLPLALIIGLILAAAAEIGDLFFSCVKRGAAVKDFSKLLPGHGGFLDRFDSIIFVTIATYIICIILYGV